MPGLGTTAYPTAGSITALVRSLVNDAPGSWATDAVLLPYVNAAYRHVQAELGNTQPNSYIKDNVLLTLPAVAAADASVQAVLNNAGYNNGTQNYIAYQGGVLQLPTDLLVPLRLWERTALSSDDFTEMVDLSSSGGLPSQLQGTRLGVWEWRTDGIYVLGATQDEQIRLRYEAAFMDMTDASSPLLIRDGQNAVAYKAAELTSSARSNTGSAQAVWKPIYDEALDLLKNSAVQRQQYVGIRRKPYSYGRSRRCL